MPQVAEESFIFTTLRFDDLLRESSANAAAAGGLPSAVYLLTHHHARLREAAENTSRGSEFRAMARLPDGLSLERESADAVAAWRAQHQDEAGQGGAFRVKIQCYGDGRLAIAVAPTLRLSHTVLFPQSLSLGVDAPAPEWSLVMDSQPTLATVATRCKTADRGAYDRARRDADIASLAIKKEVLLYDRADLIMDASITTPYFLREGQWVTPAAIYGGQGGATRRWALSHSLCKEAIVGNHSLQHGETVWLSNAVRGFYNAVYLSQTNATSS